MSEQHEPPQAAVVLREGSYLTYPHCNGFCDGGTSVVFGRLEGTKASLWRVPLNGAGEELICERDVSAEPEKLLWFDIAKAANRLAVVAENGLWIHDLSETTRGKCVYYAEAAEQCLTIPGISSDGKRALVGVRRGELYLAREIDLATGASRVLFTKPWWIGHLHYSPHDESWIGFCHEGPCAEVADRVWAWHAELAPDGCCLFAHHRGQAGKELWAGHERWSFHDTTAMVVAYGDSPGEPRGIYEVFPGGREQRLVVQGDRHWHVNISASGRWVVVDTTGPHDAPGKGWEEVNGISDVLLVEQATGRQCWLARSSLATHPYHPHPVFSPDEKFILLNEAARRRVMRVANPWWAAS